MEKLGGGGHLTAAATVIPTNNMNLVKKRLKAAIDEVLKNEEFKKVILQENVKGKGLKGEIHEFAVEQANSLIQSGQAIEATTENIRMLEQEKQEEALEAAARRKELYEIKEIVEKEALKIEVNIDENGHIQEIVNSKTIAIALEKATGRKIDRRRISFSSNIVALGLYEAQLKLSNDIFATITIHIIEKTSK